MKPPRNPTKAEILSELSAQELELKEVESQLASLTLRCYSLHSSIFNLRSRIAPISFVPRDILAEIFIQCLTGSYGYFPTMSPSEAPLLLGRVCHTWREISRTTPELWDSLDIVIPSRPEDDPAVFPIMETAVRDWLLRAGARGLSIGLTNLAEWFPYGMEPGSSPRTLYTTRLLRVLSEFAGSWQRFCTTIHWRELAEALEGTAQLEASTDLDTDQSSILERLLSKSPILEEVQFRVQRQDYYTPPPEVHVQIQSTIALPPSLRRFTLEGAAASSNHLALRLNWAGLTHLKLLKFPDRGLLVTTALELLSRCQNLISFSVLVSDGQESGAGADIPNFLGVSCSTAPDILVLSCLLELDVETWLPFHGERLFARLSLPCIQHISYAVHGDYTPLPVPIQTTSDDPTSPSFPHFRQILTMSSLRSLALSSSPEIGLDSLLIDYLEACKTLRKISIGHVDEVTLAKLTPHILSSSVETTHLTLGPGASYGWGWGAPQGWGSFPTSAIIDFLNAAVQESSIGSSSTLQLKKVLFKMPETRSHQQEELEQHVKTIMSKSGIQCVFKYPILSLPPPPPVVLKPEFWGYGLEDLR